MRRTHSMHDGKPAHCTQNEVFRRCTTLSTHSPGSLVLPGPIEAALQEHPTCSIRRVCDMNNMIGIGEFLFVHAFAGVFVVVSVQLLWESANSPQIWRRFTQPSAMRSITALETPPACKFSQYRHRYWCGIFRICGDSQAMLSCDFSFSVKTPKACWGDHISQLLCRSFFPRVFRSLAILIRAAS